MIISYNKMVKVNNENHINYSIEFNSITINGIQLIQLWNSDMEKG